MQRFLIGIVLGLVVITVTLTSVSLFRGGSEGASAAGPTPTKIANDGNLGGVADILVGDLATNVALFWCIVKTDHEFSNNAIKTALQCNTDIPGQGATGDTPVSRCDLTFACNPDLNEPDLTPGAGLPPYTNQVPAKGFGFYYPGGVGAQAAAECGSVSCTFTVSCFQDVGPPAGLGPNIMWAATVFDPKNPDDGVAYAASPAVLPGHTGWAAGTADGVTSGHVDIWYNVNNARCKSFETPARTPNFDDAALFSIAVNDKGGVNPNPNPAPWRQVAAARAPFGCGNGLTCTPTVLNWDGDGCTDEEELNKQTVEKCGDDPFNPSDSWTDTANVDLSGMYSIGIPVIRGDCTDDSTAAACIASAVPGFYFSCIADLQHNTGDNSITLRPYCYIDSPVIQINPEAYPGKFGDGHAGGLPPGAAGGPDVYFSGFLNWVYGDVDASHTELLGTFNKGTNELTVTGCFVDQDGFGGLGNTYVEFTVSAHQLPGTVDIWSFQTSANCLAGTPSGDPGTAPISLTNLNPAEGKNYDRDNDGVPDSRELQDDPACGLRDPSNGNDYYDVSVPRDGRIDLANDLLGVIQHYSPAPYVTGSPDVFATHPPGQIHTTWDNYDRPPKMATDFGAPASSPGTWNRGSPDGVIDLQNDILGVIQQYNPDGCGSGGGSLPPTAGGEMELSVTSGAVSCPEGKDPSHVCVAGGAFFTLTVEAVEIPAGGYSLAQSWLDYGNDLVFKSSDTTWPDCSDVDFSGQSSAKGSNHAHRSCATGIISLPASFHTGSLFEFNFTCSPGSSVTEVKLLGAGTNPANTSGAMFTEAGTNTQFLPAVNNVTINCLGSVTAPTPTDTPTPTPTVIPAQGLIFPVAGGSIGDTLPATAAALSSPADVAVVEPGGPQVDVYIADRDHCRIRLITVGGSTSTIAGTGECSYGGDGGLAVDAQLNHPTGVDVDASGNVYIADEGNCRVRVVDTSGNIDTFAGTGSCGNGGDGGSATAAQLDGPYDVLVDGSDLLIVDRGNCRVRVVSGGNIAHVAGNAGGACGFAGDGGSAATAQFDDPRRLALDGGGNLHIADGGNCRVRRVNSGTGNIATIAGSATCGFSGDTGAATAAELDQPDGLAFDSSGNLYIADLANCRVRQVDTGATITTVAGSDPGGGPCGYSGDGGDAASAQLNAPSAMSFDSSQRLYIADRENHRIRRVGSPITTIAGTGLPDFCGDTFVAIDDSCLDGPHDVVIDNAGKVYIADVGNHRIRVIDPGTASINTLAGKNEQTSCPDTSGANALTLCLELPRHIVVSPDNGLLYISDEARNQVWRVNVGSGTFSRVAGAANGAAGLCADNTTSLVACLDQPRGLALQQVGGTDTYLFVAEGGNDGRVLRVNLLTNTVRTVFQDSGNELSSDVALGPGDSLYIAQPDANRVRWVDTGADSEVDGTDDPPVTVAGSGSAGLTMTDGTVATLADLDGPHAIAMSNDDELLISDRNNHRLWVVRTGDSTQDVVDGEPSERIYRIAGGGSPTPGFCGDPKAKPDPTPVNAHNARDACLDSPADLSYDHINSALYFADELNQRVRKIPSDCDDDGLTDAVEEAGIESPKPELGTFFTDKCDADTDDDGCSDAAEVGSDEAGGGRRDPTNRYDFYDVAGPPPPFGDGSPDQIIDLPNDILGVIQHYAPLGTESTYDVNFDRGPQDGPNVWNMTAPDGVIDLANDILGVIRQFGHSCQ